MMSISEVLFKDYRRKVLALLLLRPDESYHVREIARLTDTHPGTLHKELAKLAEAGILKKADQGNQLRYQADRNCIVYDELASIMRKTSGLVDVLRLALQPLLPKVDFAAVYGSVASGKARATSDIDLVLIGNVSFAEVVKSLYHAQQELGREISPKVYSPEEWRKAASEKNGFLRQLITDPLLPIWGSFDDFGQLNR